MIKTAITLLAVFSFLMGSIFILFPKKTINMQIGFYRSINWKMEPLSWELEIRNTRFMGSLSIMCGVIALMMVICRR